MAPGDKIRMEQHRMHIEDEDFDKNVDCSQTVKFGSQMQVVPALLRNSCLYNILQDRLFLPQELLAVQGLPYHMEDTGSGVLDLMPSREFLRDLGRTPAKDLKSMLGNAMNVAQVGSVLALLFTAFPSLPTQVL